eukprot:Skav201355  [mRNA]  locus=scaffold2643:165000:169492:- [translate_table: standard]
MKPPDLEAYNTVAHGFARKGQVKDVEAWLSLAKEKSLQLSLDAYAKASSDLLAIGVLQRARDAKLKPNAMMYNAAMDGCARCSNFTKAQELFATLQAPWRSPGVAMGPQGRWRNGNGHGLLMVAVVAGDHDQLGSWVFEKEQEMVTMESVTSLVRAASRAKRPWQASPPA